MSQSESDNNWYKDMARCGWQMPVVSKWKRWPVIRHVRAVFHLIGVLRHRRLMSAMQSVGFGMFDTGYDWWVLHGIWKGREGRKP